MLSFILNLFKGKSGSQTRLSELDEFLHGYRATHPPSQSAEKEKKKHDEIARKRDGEVS